MSKKNQNTDNTQAVGEVINKVLAGSEQIQTEIDAKQIELEAKQKELERCLAVLERKKELSMNRQKFLSTDGNLQKVLEALEIDDFETPHFRLKLFNVESSYKDIELTSISNTDLIKEFVMMLREKIASKIVEIENELIN